MPRQCTGQSGGVALPCQSRPLFQRSHTLDSMAHQALSIVLPGGMARLPCWQLRAQESDASELAQPCTGRNRSQGCVCCAPSDLRSPPTMLCRLQPPAQGRGLCAGLVAGGGRAAGRRRLRKGDPRVGAARRRLRCVGTLQVGHASCAVRCKVHVCVTSALLHALQSLCRTQGFDWCTAASAGNTQPAWRTSSGAPQKPR